MLVVATEDFEVYHELVTDLRGRDVPFTTVEPECRHHGGYPTRRGPDPEATVPGVPFARAGPEKQDSSAANPYGFDSDGRHRGGREANRRR